METVHDYDQIISALSLENFHSLICLKHNIYKPSHPQKHAQLSQIKTIYQVKVKTTEKHADATS